MHIEPKDSVRKNNLHIQALFGIYPASQPLVKGEDKEEEDKEEDAEEQDPSDETSVDKKVDLKSVKEIKVPSEDLKVK